MERSLKFRPGAQLENHIDDKAQTGDLIELVLPYRVPMARLAAAQAANES